MRRTKRKWRRKSWRTASGGPSTASRASWETDVSELLELSWLMWEKVVGTSLCAGVIFFSYQGPHTHESPAEIRYHLSESIWKFFFSFSIQLLKCLFKLHFGKY